MPIAHTPPTAADRQSHFREASMEEYTLAGSRRDDASASASEGPLGRRLRDLRSFQIDGSSPKVKMISRLANGVARLSLSFILLAIMAEFVVRYGGDSRRKPQAIALITLVATDCVLDIYYMIRIHKKWQGWATSLRLLLALGYIAQFLVYIGLSQVFPSDYAYWGMGAGYSDPVVYLLLWVIGIWNLLHTAVHRHSLGRDLRRYASASQVFSRRPNPSDLNPRANVHRPQTSISGPIVWTGDPTYTESGGDPEEVAIYLDALPLEDKKEEATVTTRAVSPSTAGASSSQTLTVGSDDDSRRTSIAGSGQTLNVGGEAHESDVQKDTRF